MCLAAGLLLLIGAKVCFPSHKASIIISTFSPAGLILRVKRSVLTAEALEDREDTSSHPNAGESSILNRPNQLMTGEVELLPFVPKMQRIPTGHADPTPISLPLINKELEDVVNSPLIRRDPRQRRDVLPPTAADEQQGIDPEEIEYEVDIEQHQIIKKEEGAAITDVNWMTKYLNSSTNSQLSFSSYCTIPPKLVA